MRNLLVAFGFGALAMVTAPACGGGGGGGGGGSGLSSGVNPTKRGNEVTSDEVTQVCEAMVDYAEATLATVDLCRVAGVLRAAFATGDDSLTEENIQELCAEGVQECQADLEEQSEQEGDCSQVEVPAECSATVGELERCYQDQVDVAADLFKGLPDCGSVTRDFAISWATDFLTSWLDSNGEIKLPESCDAIDEACYSLVAFDETVPSDGE